MTGAAANMPEILEKLGTDFPSVGQTKHMTATVHRALGGSRSGMAPTRTTATAIRGGTMDTVIGGRLGTC